MSNYSENWAAKILLLIKFQNEEEQHNWDVGIYINFKIINSLEEENLFLQEMMKKKN